MTSRAGATSLENRGAVVRCEPRQRQPRRTGCRRRNRETLAEDSHGIRGLPRRGAHGPVPQAMRDYYIAWTKTGSSPTAGSAPGSTPTRTIGGRHLRRRARRLRGGGYSRQPSVSGSAERVTSHHRAGRARRHALPLHGRGSSTIPSPRGIRLPIDVSVASARESLGDVSHASATPSELTSAN